MRKILFAALLALAATGASVFAAPSATRPVLNLHKLTPPKDPYVSDEQIGQAIDKGQAWLMDQFAGGKIKKLVDHGDSDYAKDEPLRYIGPGANALAVYALYQCGLASHKAELDPKNAYMKGLLDTMKSIAVVPNVGTYTCGIRATALSSVNRKEDQNVISLDVFTLLDGCRGGAYTYNTPSDAQGSWRKQGYLQPPKGWDNSNSQYGLLGVWSAAEIGAEIPQDYWAVIEKHWTDTQLPDGQWYYDSSRNQGRITMTLAGIASLFVCHDFLDVPGNGDKVGREPFSPPLAKGLEWLEDGNHATLEGARGYGRYGLERVGLASGFKYFGTHDWYREQATRALADQKPDGSFDFGRAIFTSDLVETSYNLLFLSRGRHPILMNKLRFDHYWANRPRDVANLCTFAGKELETPFNWQVVPVSHDWPDWTDAPVLYIASHEAPKFSDADYAKFRAFAESGGLIFTQADGASKAFNDFIEKTFVPKVFPNYELAKVPPTHPLFNVYEQFKGKNVPPLQMISNGARVLMVHSAQDLAYLWQQRESKSHGDAFKIGLNLFVYSGGKSDFRNRLSSSYIPAPPADQISATLNVARVRYPLPTWDPEPYAWTRFSNWLAWDTSVAVKTQAVDMDKLGDLDPIAFPLAHLTGTNPYTPTDAEIKGIQTYVNNGGTLLIDPCGGADFNDSIAKLLAKAFPDVKAERLPANHSAYTFDANAEVDLSKVQVRPYTVHTIGHSPPPPQLLKAGKGQVISLQIDLTNGLLGSRTWGVNGYDTPWALQFLKNVVLATSQGK